MSAWRIVSISNIRNKNRKAFYSFSINLISNNHVVFFSRDEKLDYYDISRV